MTASSLPQLPLSEEQKDTYEMPSHGWTCFHCGETFRSVGSARTHFGTLPRYDPGCVKKVQIGDERGWLSEIRKQQDFAQDMFHRAEASDEAALAATQLASDLARRVEELEKDANLLDRFEKVDGTIYYTTNEWKGRKESGWTYWTMFGVEGPELYSTARAAMQACVDDPDTAALKESP